MHSQVAVKGVVIGPDGRALIMREGERWQVPGGRLEKGERLHDGLRRKVFEETGLTGIAIKKVVHVDEWFSMPEGDLAHIVALFFHCVTSSRDITLSNEHNEFAWVLPHELEKYAIEPEIEKAIKLTLA